MGQSHDGEKMKETDIDSIKEFLIESAESLGRLDREMVELERRPEDTKLLASIFRTIHTMKGMCGFLGYRTIERVTHHAENPSVRFAMEIVRSPRGLFL